MAYDKTGKLLGLLLLLMIAFGFSGSAGAIPIQLSVAGFTKTVDPSGFANATLNIPALTLSGNVADGDMLSGNATFDVSGAAGYSDFDQSFTATRSFTLDFGASGTQTGSLSQSADLFGQNYTSDGGRTLVYGVGADIDPASDVVFNESGIGSFIITAGGGSASDYCNNPPISGCGANSVLDDSGTFPVSVRFNALAPPTTAVAEPPTWPLLGIAILGLVLGGYRMRRS